MYRQEYSWLAVVFFAIAGPASMCIAQGMSFNPSQTPQFTGIPVIHAQMDPSGQTARLYNSAQQQSAAQSDSSSGYQVPQPDSSILASRSSESGPIIEYSDMSDVDFGCDCGGKASCGFMAGVEATFLRPSLDSRQVVFPNTTFVLGAFDWEFESAPRVWVSWQNECGFGLRSRYWQLDAEADPFDDIIVGPQVILLNEAHSQLEFYTVDLEATQRWHPGCWSVLASVGARHGSIAHQYVFKSFAMDPTGVGINTQFLSRRFDGTGITLGLETVRPLGHSPFSFVFNARGSTLWGDNKSSNRNIMGQQIGGPPAVTNTSVRQRCPDMLVIGEMQLGIEWNQGFTCCGGGLMFASIMGEVQFWDLGDCNIAGVIHGADSLGNGEVGLYGWTASVGFRR